MTTDFFVESIKVIEAARQAIFRQGGAAGIASTVSRASPASTTGVGHVIGSKPNAHAQPQKGTRI